MDKRKHRRSRRFLSALMVLAMLVSLLPAGAFAQSGTTEPIQVAWDSSKSKTATNLDANYESEVTLSLPAADYQKSIDVVFVIDDTHAGSGIFAESAKGLVDSLAAQDNLDINLGIVTFDAVARDWLEVTSEGQYSGLESLDDESAVTAIRTAIGTELSSNGTGMAKRLGGSNTEWAVEMATDMLSQSNAEEQYMVMFSDMYGYVYHGDLTIDDQTFSDVPLSKRVNNDTQGTLTLLEPSSDNWEELYNGWKTKDKPEKDSFFRDSVWTNYWENYQSNTTVPTIPTDAPSITKYDEDGYFTAFDKSLCMTYERLQNAIDQDIKVAIINNDFDPDTAPSVTTPGQDSGSAGGECVRDLKDEMLATLSSDAVIVKEETVNGGTFTSDQMDSVFSTLENKLIQVVDEGSYVIDEIGSGSYILDDKTYDYDFDFVNKIEKLTLTVDGQALTATPIDQSDATAAWKFGEDSQFELYYYQEGTTVEEKSYDECFVWKINVPIMKDTPVQLTYSVKLSNPQTDAGTHGQYDENGSKDYAGLFTNNSATLYPVDSLGNANYAPEEFDKPTVSYTAEAVGITPAPITIYTGGNGYTSVVGDDGEEVEEPTTTDTNGLPTPGFYITLPEDINTKLLEVLEGSEDVNENGVIDLSSYLTFTYDDGEENRTWTLERYDNKAGNTSMANGNYIYRINPAKTADGLEPIRLQFTNEKGDTMNSDDFVVSLSGLYLQYDMTIYPGDLDQSLVKAVIDVPDKYHKEFDATVGTDKLTIRGVTDEQTATTEIAGHDEAIGDLTNVTAQLTNADTKFYINGSDLEVAPDNEVKLLVDSTVDETGNATMVDHAIDKYDGIITEEHNVELKYLDLVDTTNGNAWVTASAPVTINWPYPDGAEQDDEFYVVHYNGLNRDEGGSLSDIDTNLMEIYAVNPSDGQQKLTKTGQGLQFEVDSFSPFAVYWKEAESDNPGGGGTVIVPDDPDEEDPDTPTLNTEDHYSYIVGYPEDYRTGEATDDESLWPVKPQGNITRAEVATIFYRLLTNDARSENWTTSNDYTDVSADSWYNTPVSTLSAMGIVRGYEDGSFRPNASITRAEFAAIAVRFFESDAVNYEEGLFTDIAGSEWFADAVQAAKDHDIIGGYPDGTFKPNNPITRAEACSIVNRTTKRVPDADHLLAEDQMRNWPDNANTEAWYYADMQEATNGHYYDYVLDDNEEIVREEWTSAREPIDWDAVEAELEASH